MENEADIAWRPLAILAIVIALAMFAAPLAIRFPLLDPDEGLHASIALGMVESGDWTTPRFLGRPFLDKPIFYFWMQALSLRLLGPSETAVRLPGLLFGLLGAATTALLAWRMFGRAVGLIAGILYATMILPVALAQAASHDVALVPWVNLTILLLWECRRAAGHRAAIACAVGAGVFLGLSILTKGLMGVGVVAVAFGGWLLIEWRQCWTDPRQRRWLVLLPLIAATAAVVAAPWYVAVESQNPGFLRYYFLDRHILGLATDTQPHSDQPWWYYVPVLLAGGLPWIGYLAGFRVQGSGFRHQNLSVLNPEPRTLNPFPLLWCWLLGWTLLLSLAQSKLATYLWPAFPAVAILAAVVWSRWIARRESQAASRAFARTFVGSSWTGPIVLPAVLAVVQWYCEIRFSWPVWAVVCLAAAAAPFPLVPWRLDRRLGCLTAASLSLAAQFLVVMALVLPPAAETFSARALAEHFNRLGRLPPRLFVAEERIGSLVFYLTPELRAGLKLDQLERVYRNQPLRLRQGDVLAVPERGRRQAATYLDLDGASRESVGRYELYRAR